MKTAVIYARYSSERQTEQSIEGQLRVCREYAERNDFVILSEYIDRATTGTNDKRDSFQQMMKDSNKKIWDYVLVYKLDRFSRNKYEMAMHRKTLKDNGVKLLSAMENIPDTPEGIILESLLEGMAEYYSAELSQKIRRGLKESRLKGNFTGGPVPYGYIVDKKKVFVNHDEAQIVKYIYSQYANDVFVKDIIADLNQKGLLYKGKPFARTTVYNILQNEKYSGIIRHGYDVFNNIYPRIVSEDVFNLVRKKAEENHFGKHISPVQYILKNKIKCGYCGNSVNSETGTARDGTIRRYYKCNGRKLNHKCNKSVIRKDILEEIIIKTTIKVLGSDKMLSDIANDIFAAQTKRMINESIVNLLTKEIQETNKSINNLISAIEKGIITKSTKSRLDELEQKLQKLQENLLIEQSREQTKITKMEIIKFIKTVIKKEPKQMISLLIQQIVLYDDKIEIFYNFTDSKRPDPNGHQVFLFHEEMFSKTYTYEQFNVNAQDYNTCKTVIKIKVELYI